MMLAHEIGGLLVKTRWWDARGAAPGIPRKVDAQAPEAAGRIKRASQDPSI